MKVDSLPYQWLIVKNKTIIGPKTTEEQKVLFIPPKAGVYQCVLTVCSWPAFAEAEVAVRANIFPKRVVLVGMAENPTLEVSMFSLIFKMTDTSVVMQLCSAIIMNHLFLMSG